MKSILIVGAGFLQNYLIKKAKSMGYYTLAIDADEQAPGFLTADESSAIDIIDKEACLEYAMGHSIDGIVTAATDFGVITTAYVAEKMGLRGTTLKAAELVKNKYLVRKILFENHVDSTGQGYEVNMETDVDVLARELSYPVMVKPCDGSGSRGASRVDAPNKLGFACEYAMKGSITHRAEIESFVDGKEYGAEILVVDKMPYVMAVMRKWMTEPPFYAELGHAIPSGLSEQLEARIKDCVGKAVRALSIENGAVNMDILVTNDEKIYIIDIGARMGGNLIGSHIIPLGTGIDYMANILRNAVGESVDFERFEARCVTTRLLAFKEGIINRLPEFDTFEKQYGVKVEHHLQVGAHVHEYHTNLDGYGYIVAFGTDANESTERAERAKKALSEYIFEE